MEIQTFSLLTPILIHLVMQFNTCLLSSYHGPGTVLGTEEGVENRQTDFPLTWNVVVVGNTKGKQTSSYIYHMSSEDQCYEEQLSQLREHRDREGASIWYEVVRKGLPTR